MPLSKQALDIIDGFQASAEVHGVCQSCYQVTVCRHQTCEAGGAEGSGLPKQGIHDLGPSATLFINAGGPFRRWEGARAADYQYITRYSHLADDTLQAAVEAGARTQWHFKQPTSPSFIIWS